MNVSALMDLTIVIKGAGDLATGIAVRLKNSGFSKILMLEKEKPLAVRRTVAFCEAVWDGDAVVEGIRAVCVSLEDDLEAVWQCGDVPVVVDPQWKSLDIRRPDVVIDAILAKKNLGTTGDEAPLVIGLGPGFSAGDDVHVVIETCRGHDLGRVITCGCAKANTGAPGEIGGYTVERVLRAPADGIFHSRHAIGDLVMAGDVVGEVAGKKVHAKIGGVLRGLIRQESEVFAGLKIGDIDPRGEVKNGQTVSDKARAIGGAVLEAILASYCLVAA